MYLQSRDNYPNLEDRVVEASIAYFKSQEDWTERGIVVPFADLYDNLWGATDDLIKAREDQK